MFGAGAVFRDTVPYDNVDTVTLLIYTAGFRLNTHRISYI